MKKVLKLDTVLTDFEDNELKADDKGTLLTLKKALLRYVEAAHAMGLSGNDEMTLYFIGRKIGKTKDGELLKLSLQDYNLLKKIAETGKVQQGNTSQSIFLLVAAQQIRVLLDEAENEKETADDKEAK